MSGKAADHVRKRTSLSNDRKLLLIFLSFLYFLIPGWGISAESLIDVYPHLDPIESQFKSEKMV